MGAIIQGMRSVQGNFLQRFRGNYFEKLPQKGVNGLRGGDFSSRAIVRGTATIRGNTVSLYDREKETLFSKCSMYFYIYNTEGKITECWLVETEGTFS